MINMGICNHMHSVLAGTGEGEVEEAETLLKPFRLQYPRVSDLFLFFGGEGDKICNKAQPLTYYAITVTCIGVTQQSLAVWRCYILCKVQDTSELSQIL